VGHGDGKLSGSCLREAPAGVELRLGGELHILLAGSAHPPREPLSCQGGLRGAQSPRAGPDANPGPQSSELLNRKRDGVRAEQAAPLSHAALVGLKSGAHTAIQRMRRGQLDMTDHG